MTWTTTMAAIYRRDPCKDGWAKLRKHTGLPATPAAVRWISAEQLLWTVVRVWGA